MTSHLIVDTGALLELVDHELARGARMPSERVRRVLHRYRAGQPRCSIATADSIAIAFDSPHWLQYLAPDAEAA